VPIPDNEQFEQFERYLKQFQPVQPTAIDEFAVVEIRRAWRSRTVWIAAVAVLLIVSAGVLRVHRSGTALISNKAIGVPDNQVHKDPPSAPLTIRSANAWMAQAPSVKTGIDMLAFSSQIISLKNGKQSAIAVLSKEKIKL
jgi:hypothetical protein